jgi:hypothetical protein
MMELFTQDGKELSIINLLLYNMMKMEMLLSQKKEMNQKSYSLILK